MFCHTGLNYTPSLAGIALDIRNEVEIKKLGEGKQPIVVFTKVSFHIAWIVNTLKSLKEPYNFDVSFAGINFDVRNVTSRSSCITIDCIIIVNVLYMSFL